MSGTKDNPRQAAPQLTSRELIIEEVLSDLDPLVNTIAAAGKLDALIALACKRAQSSEDPSIAEAGNAHDQGARIAIEAYADWERTKDGFMDTDVRQHAGVINPAEVEPEVLPLSLAGKWVAWSSDGMRIIASSESSEEAERLAIAAGELEPILERHPGRYRL